MLLCFIVILAHSLSPFSEKNCMLLCFTMIWEHLLVLLFIKSRRRPKAVQGAPRDPTGTPQVPHRYPRTAKRIAKEGQWEPKGVWKGAKGTPASHKGSHKCSGTAKWSPRASQREQKGVQGGCKASTWHPKDTQGKPAGHYIFENSQ